MTRFETARGGEGVEDLGDGGATLPHPPEYPPLPLQGPLGHVSARLQGEGSGKGVRRAAAFLRSLP
jgi:hypothetical protein